MTKLWERYTSKPAWKEGPKINTAKGAGVHSIFFFFIIRRFLTPEGIWWHFTLPLLSIVNVPGWEKFHCLVLIEKIITEVLGNKWIQSQSTTGNLFLFVYINNPDRLIITLYNSKIKYSSNLWVITVVWSNRNKVR